LVSILRFTEKAFDKAFQLEDDVFKAGDHLPPHHFTQAVTTTTTTTTTQINGQQPQQQQTTNATSNEGRHKKNSLGKSGSLGSEALSLPSVLGASLKPGEQQQHNGRNSNAGQANNGGQNQGSKLLNIVT
jgi:hypothetical protein